MKEIPFDRLIKNRGQVYILSATRGKAIKATLALLDFNDRTASFLADEDTYSAVPFDNYGVTWSLDLNDLKLKTTKKTKRWQRILGAMNGDKKNIYPHGITDSEFREFIIEEILGDDWYVCDSISQDQVNEAAFMEIVEKLKERG